MIKIINSNHSNNIAEMNIDGYYASYVVKYGETILFILKEDEIKQYKLSIELPFNKDDPEGSLERFIKLLSLS